MLQICFSLNHILTHLLPDQSSNSGNCMITLPFVIGGCVL